MLVRMQDLLQFEDWSKACQIHVEHGSDGPRILSLMEMASRFRREQAKIQSLRAAGKRTAFAETMYVLDLSLDPRCATLPIKPVPWDRYADVLKDLNLAAV